MKRAVKRMSLGITVLMVTMVTLNIVDMPLELRFEQAEYNYLFVMALGVLLPLSLLATSVLYKERLNLWVIVPACSLLVIPCGLVAFVAYDSFLSIRHGGVDESFEKIGELTANDIHYRLYRTNGGATTAFGLVLRKENELLAGVKSVEVLFSQYRAVDGTLSLSVGRRHRTENTALCGRGAGKRCTVETIMFF